MARTSNSLDRPAPAAVSRLSITAGYNAYPTAEITLSQAEVEFLAEAKFLKKKQEILEAESEFLEERRKYAMEKARIEGEAIALDMAAKNKAAREAAQSEALILMWAAESKAKRVQNEAEIVLLRDMQDMKVKRQTKEAEAEILMYAAKLKEQRVAREAEAELLLEAEKGKEARVAREAEAEFTQKAVKGKESKIAREAEAELTQAQARRREQQVAREAELELTQTAAAFKAKRLVSEAEAQLTQEAASRRNLAQSPIRARSAEQNQLKVQREQRARARSCLFAPFRLLGCFGGDGGAPLLGSRVGLLDPIDGVTQATVGLVSGQLCTVVLDSGRSATYHRDELKLLHDQTLPPGAGRHYLLFVDRPRRLRERGGPWTEPDGDPLLGTRVALTGLPKRRHEGAMGTVAAVHGAQPLVYRVVFDDSTAIAVNRANMYTLSPSLNYFIKTGKVVAVPPSKSFNSASFNKGASRSNLEPGPSDALKKRNARAPVPKEHYMPGRTGAGAGGGPDPKGLRI